MNLVTGGAAVYGYPIGVILLDTKFPRACGDIGNSRTFQFNITHTFVENASPKRVVCGDRTALLLDDFVQRAQRFRQDLQLGAITTGCGFLALFQEPIAAALDIPFFSSSLMQVPFVAEMIGREKKICIMTANSDNLTAAHYQGAGWNLEDYNVVIQGMQDYPNFAAPMVYNEPVLKEEAVREEMITAAREIKQKHSDIAAFVFECTNMPPYAKDVQEVTNCPVFDIVTLTNYIHDCLVF